MNLVGGTYPTVHIGTSTYVLQTLSRYVTPISIPGVLFPTMMHTFLSVLSCNLHHLQSPI